MLLDHLLAQEEGKTLEFKENSQSLTGIAKTVVAFANTAGGTIVVGVRDKTKEVVGLDDILEDETRIANAITNLVEPLLTPTLQMITWRGRDLLLIEVCHSVGPYHFKRKGEDGGTYVRFGSTNRPADQIALGELRRLKSHETFDTLPRVGSQLSDLDWDLARELFNKQDRNLTKSTAQSIGMVVSHQGEIIPSNGGLILFGKEYWRWFPHVEVRCAYFRGEDTADLGDMLDLQEPIPLLVDKAMEFIRRHTRISPEMEDIRRRDIPEHSLEAVREALLNALVHTDYEVVGAPIRIAVFRDRIEITSPGCLTYGLSLERALSGVSQLRNKVVGRVFRQLGLIEEWGLGLDRIQRVCKAHGSSPPQFEELDNFFRVTLFSRQASKAMLRDWEESMVGYLRDQERITHKEAKAFWGVADRTARGRLKAMVSAGLLSTVGTSRYDPNKVYVLKR